jgi:serine/threonine protein kinase/Flp pilus assembly protein TadD
VATTPAKRACSVCGALLADDTPFCPVCAFHQALGTQPYSVSNSSSELRFEHYTVLQNVEGKPFELGRGGMGVTYKAFDVHLQRPAALKIINAQLFGNESARLRFIREARAAASVRHSNVASVFHIGESGGNYYYAMEFVEGESLAAFIRRSGCLETDPALEIVEQVAFGLTAIEEQHLVHRDIKPSNVMVSLKDGKLKNAKIIDLGLAKGVAEENALSTVGAFVGTPAYASPEQFAGIATDIRSDFYSLGVTLWEMLSGKVPYSGSAAELMYQHQHAEPPIERLKNVPAPVIALLQVLLAKDPGQRFQTPAQLQQALTKVSAAIASGSTLTADELRSAGELLAVKSSRAKPRKQAVRWLLGSGFCLAVISIAWFFYTHHLVLPNQGTTPAALAEKSIAVLPFENISANRDDAYFADGVQDEILNNLAKIGQLKVICRTSVMQYRADTKRDLHEIANALGVANILEGTVRRDGNHVRISTELVDAHTYNTIWADSYDRELTDIFAIQSEIAQNVASKLRARLAPHERKDIEEKPTSDMEAYDLYLRAKELIANAEFYEIGDERENLLSAINFLEEATRKDSRFVLAYCLVARAHDDLYLNIDTSAARRTLGDAAVKETLRLQPDLPEAHLAAARHLYYCYRDYEKVRAQMAIVQRALPNDPEALTLSAMADRRQGRWSESTRALQRVVNLDPRNPEAITRLFENYLCLRRYREAEKVCDRLLELGNDKPGFRVLKASIAFAEKADVTGYRAAVAALPSSAQQDMGTTGDRTYLAALDHDWAAAEEILSNNLNEELIFFCGTAVPPGCVEIWLAMARGAHLNMDGRSGSARDQLKQKLDADPSDPKLLSALAIVDAALGRKDDAIQEARHAVELEPISEDAMDGPSHVYSLAVVYARTNEPDLAFQQLAILARTTSRWTSYGLFKLDPGFDPLRKDQRFDRLLAQLVPH